jgi:hypothetical protein
MWGYTVHTIAMGLVSVMPQGCITRTPNFSKRRKRLSGAADTATITRKPGAICQGLTI